MDSFFGIGIFELVMIAIIALVVMGPERLPGAMREVAKYMKQLRSISHEFQSQFSEELKMLEEIDPRRILNEAIDPNARRARLPPNHRRRRRPPRSRCGHDCGDRHGCRNCHCCRREARCCRLPSLPHGAPPAIANGEPANTILPPPRPNRRPNCHLRRQSSHRPARPHAGSPATRRHQRYRSTPA